MAIRVKSPSPQQADVECLPFANVEKALEDHYREPDFPHRLPGGKGFNTAKDLFQKLQQDHIMSIEQINRYLIDKNRQALEPLVAKMQQFLSATA